ncbi:hypothetical protein OHB54_22130 [Streptomyces sp. NBC_01007]|nr:hypothetical protein OHB54_22130 [Streptomyces sp. NBC_01007]
MARASRSFVLHWSQEPRPLHGAWVDGVRDGSASLADLPGGLRPLHNQDVTDKE